MVYYAEPLEEIPEPTGFEPLEWDDSEEEEDPTSFFDDEPTQAYLEDEYEERGLGGFDDLKPFGSFSDGLGWDDGLL